jgi:negative regulator of sigma E activity
VKLPLDGHAQFQALISARLDGMLDPADELALSAHVAQCSRCRQTRRDYGLQRAMLAKLPPPPPPRDLWARTAAALDREMAAAPHASGAGAQRRQAPKRSAPGSRWLGLTAATSVLLAGAVVATQLDGGGFATPSTGTRTVRATPFDVAPQDIAFVNFTSQGVSVYQTQVREACPVAVIDCTSATIDPKPVLSLKGGNAGSRGLAVNSRSGRLAVVAGNESGSDSISVVSLPPYEPPEIASSPTPKPSSDSSGSEVATASPAVGRPTTPPTPGKPDRTPSVDATPRPTADAAATDAATPTNPPPTKAPNKTDKPDATPTPGDSPPDASSPPDRTPQTEPSTEPSTEPGTKGASPDPSLASPPAAEVALSIAEDVRLAGAAPAWSADGEMLAFSAMPADLSTGPDVYLWRAGDAKASRVTSDHRSYFASWIAGRVVISRVVAAAETDADSTETAPSIETVVLDLASGEQRIADGPVLWLPALDPAARVALAWVGRLRTDGSTISPAAGGLYLIDWTAIDPFAAEPGDEPVASPDPSEAPATEVPEPSSSPAATRRPRGSQTPALPLSTRTPGSRKAPASPEPSDEANPTAEPVASAPASAPAVTKVILQPVEPQRDEALDPVLDWVVRWSTDSTTVGYWVADAPRSNWGRLSIRHITLADGRFALESVLGPNLARRAFSMGSDRVAWVSPSEDSSDGELRIRTWDAHGFGDLRIHTLDTGGGVPAF